MLHPSTDKTEDEEFEEIEQRLIHASKTFKLTLRAIKNLDRVTSNKFVLNLDDSPSGMEKWEQLSSKPFGFLYYNDAKFCVNMTCSVSAEESIGFGVRSIFDSQYSKYTFIKNRIEDKRKFYIAQVEKLIRVCLKLRQQIDSLKVRFEEKSSEGINAKLLNFMAERTKINITIIREAENIANRQILALKNKRLTKKPIEFFKRMVRLYLGNTGNDILNDIEKLGVTSEEDYLLLIEYLYFLITMIEENKNKFVSPVIAIVDENMNGIGYKNSKLLKLMACHMFFHIIHVQKVPVAPPPPPESAPPAPPPTLVVKG